MAEVQRVLAANPSLDRASILSMHRDTACLSLFRAKTRRGGLRPGRLVRIGFAG